MEKSAIKALTFDLFGTILDLGGSLTPYIAEFLKAKDADITADRFWDQWRARQRIEQYQDTLVMLGHSGYLETVRRAFVYVLNLNKIQTSGEEVQDFMGAWDMLSPFPEVLPALERLKSRYQLVILSNGDPHFLDHLAKNRVRWDFDDIISGNGCRRVQATPRGLPLCRYQQASAQRGRVPDGFRQFVRCDGRKSLRLQIRVYQSLRTAV